MNESDDSVSNDRGDRESDKDFVVIGVKETTIPHEEVGNTVVNALGQEGPTLNHLSKN